MGDNRPQENVGYANVGNATVEGQTKNPLGEAPPPYTGPPTLSYGPTAGYQQPPPPMQQPPNPQQQHQQFAYGYGTPPPPMNGDGPYPPYPAGPVLTTVVHTTNVSGPRFACGHCQGQFTWHQACGLAICPFCHRKSAVGNWRNRRATWLIIIGCIFLFLGIGVTVITFVAETSWYFVWFGGIILGIIFLIRGLLLLCMVKEARPICA